MARIPATEEVKFTHPGAAETLLLKDDETGTFEWFIYDKDGKEIARHWGSFQRD